MNKEKNNDRSESEQVLSKEETSKKETTIIATQKKERDPKKIEAGKRLAQISKEAKERKKKKMLEEENYEEKTSFGFSILTSTIIVSILSLGMISYMYFKNKQPSNLLTQKKEKEEPIVENKKDTKSFLDNFDLKKKSFFFYNRNVYKITLWNLYGFFSCNRKIYKKVQMPPQIGASFFSFNK